MSLSDTSNLLIYFISLVVCLVVLYFVKWDKILVRDNRPVAIVLYVLCSLGLAFLVGSFFTHIIDINL